MSSPTWGDLTAFRRADQWARARQTKHLIYTKVLADGTSLRTEASRGKDSETIGEGLFHFILRVELQVSEDEFWRAIRTGKPADRPAHPAPRPAVRRPDAGVVFQLREHLGLGDDQIAKLSRDEAIAMLNDHYSKPR